MKETTEWNGHKYRRYPECKSLVSRYFHRTENKQIVFLHREVWVHNHGIIPEGYVVHHVDEDITNNRIENLMLLPRGAHFSIHKTEWHQTPEGRKMDFDFANKKGKYTGIPHFLPQEHVEPTKKCCLQCGSEFMDRSAACCAKFCSKSCSGKYAWKNNSEYRSGVLKKRKIRREASI